MLETIKNFKMEARHWIGLILGFVGMVASAIIFKVGNMFYFLFIICLMIMVLPFMLSIFSGQEKQKEKDEMFLAFARDLVENVRSGTPISKSILNLRTREYGALSPHIQKLANQISMGITLNSALNNFAKESRSSTIARAVGLISQAERAGGKIETILESVANSINQIETLKKERKAAVSNLVTQGYIIFMVFILIMLVLEFKILPLVTGIASPPEGADFSINQMDSTEFSRPLFFMLLVQSFFAGLVIGKISEGTIKAGIRHSFILLALTLLISTGARAFFG